MVATRKGQPFDYNELSELPGFAPIPVHTAQPAAAPQTSVQARPSQPRPAAVPAPVQPTTTNTGLGSFFFLTER